MVVIFEALALALLLVGTAGTASAAERPDLGVLMGEAAKIERLRALIIVRDGKVVAERAFRGPGLETPVNIKSISKSIISALAGIAVERGVFKGAGQTVAPLLTSLLPGEPDPRLRRLTLDHLLSMRSGLERTSGRNYGRWVASPHWARFALARPFVDEPGGTMLYSTGNFHIVSTLLTRLTKRSTLALARDWLGKPLGIRIPAWQKSPEGTYFGGNNMKLSPRALVAFGEMYRQKGVYNGKRVLSERWIEQSWTPRAQSPWSGDFYGLGWFMTEFDGATAYYARGFGGQFLYVIPARRLTIVMTSNPAIHTRIDGYRYHLLALAGQIVAAVGK